MKRLIALALVALPILCLGTPAAADDEAEVGTCLRLIAQEGSPEGKRMVSADSFSLMLMKEAVYSFTLFAGLSYEINTCAAANVTDLDAYIYDQDGKLVEAKTEMDRQPTFNIKTERTGTYYLVLKLMDTNNQQPGAVGYVQMYE